MTREEILALLAGDKLNRLVAEKVFGWTRFETKFIPGFDCPGMDMLFGIPKEEERLGPVPYYSENIEDAWLVVEKIRLQEGFWMMLTTAIGGTDEPESNFECRFADFHRKTLDDSGLWLAWGDTAPLAICRAALLTVLKEQMP